MGSYEIRISSGLGLFSVLSLFSVIFLFLAEVHSFAADIVTKSNASANGETAPPAPLTPVQQAEANLPQKLETLGVNNPRQVNIHWTAYYVTPVKMAQPDKGHRVTFIDSDGVKHRVFLTSDSANAAQMEAVAVGIDKQGNKRYAFLNSDGNWHELPEGAAGMGNKVNVLVPLMHVAADQRRYPYGSLVFFPAAAGVQTRTGKVLDGYFWVSDTGSAIVGNHIDMFVGDDIAYANFTHRDLKDSYPTTIYPLPKLPEKLNPHTDAGLAAILRSQDLLKDKSDPPDKEKLIEALILFQQANPHIPNAEYGDPNGATTLWFLTQTGEEMLLADKKK